MNTTGSGHSNRQFTSLEGRVERVTFHSTESGFAVLRIKVKGKRDLQTVVGSIPSVHEGEWIKARGTWSLNPKHGHQFRAEEIQTSNPQYTCRYRKVSWVRFDQGNRTPFLLLDWLNLLAWRFLK